MVTLVNDEYVSIIYHKTLWKILFVLFDNICTLTDSCREFSKCLTAFYQCCSTLILNLIIFRQVIFRYWQLYMLRLNFSSHMNICTKLLRSNNLMHNCYKVKSDSLVSQVLPVYPASHTHVYLSTPSWHLPWMQGVDLHSSISFFTMKINIFLFIKI